MVVEMRLLFRNCVFILIGELISIVLFCAFVACVVYHGLVVKCGLLLLLSGLPKHFRMEQRDIFGERNRENHISLRFWE